MSSLILQCCLLVLAADADEPLPVDPTGRLNEHNLGRVCDNKIRAYLELFGGLYQLDPGQRERFERRLWDLKPPQIRYSLSVAAERANLHEQALVEINRLVEKLGPVQTRPSEEQLLEAVPSMARMKAIRAREPLFHRDRICDELDVLLPAEQARAGRARYETFKRETAERMVAEMERERQAIGEGSLALLEPGDQWSSYVARFCEKFSLDEAQRATADSILRDVVARRDAHLDRHREEWTTLRTWTPPQDPVEASGPASRPAVDRHALFIPIEKIWAELRARLDEIPTADQVKAVRDSEPRFTGSRPSDYVSPRGPQTPPDRLPATRPA